MTMFSSSTSNDRLAITRTNHALAGLMAAAAIVMAGCSSTPLETKPAPAPAQVPAPAPAPTAQPAPVTPPAPVLAAHLDPNSAVYRSRSVFFDFDESTIRPQDRPAIETQGQYLSGAPSLQVRVEGNTDSRGGSEYNLALGQRRAEAVKTALKVYGVKDTQVEAVSYGKERPKALGNDEASWAQNRRADVVYPGATK